MLRAVEVQTSGRPGAWPHCAATLQREFPGLSVLCREPEESLPAEAIFRRGTTVVVPARAWHARTFDPLSLDEATSLVLRDGGAFTLAITDDPAGPVDLTRMGVQVVTRCQRYIAGGNRHSENPLFEAARSLHRSWHSLDKPLVAADYDHALDTRRWVLRLEPEASWAVQVAALFHDVERLSSESERRIEQRARDYGAFKAAHAAGGAELTRACLRGLGVPAWLADRTAVLVATHERGDEGDPESLLLREADALSFFSLNACGFARYYGPDHTEKKVAYTFARLGARGRRALSSVRHRPDIAAMLGRASAPRRAITGHYPSRGHGDRP